MYLNLICIVIMFHNIAIEELAFLVIFKKSPNIKFNSLSCSLLIQQ